MGLLDGGVARLFGGIFGALYPEAMLHLPVRNEGRGGSIAKAFTGDPGQAAGTPIKAQRDSVNAAMRQAEGFADTDVRFIILTRYGPNGEIELPEPPQGAQITWPWPGGGRYTVEAPITLEGAGSHYTVRGRPVV